MARVDLKFEDGPTIKATVVKSKSCLAVHRSFDGKAFVLTHLPTMRCVGRRRLQRDAIAMRKELDALDWTDPAKIEAEVCTIVDYGT
jgi:hypothetical protein